MFSKINKYFGRFDIKLTVYNTLIILLLASVLTGFFIYRLHRGLTKQIDRLLRDECRELILEWKENADIIISCSKYEADIANRKHFPIFFRIFNASGEVLYISKNATKIPFLPPKNKKNYFTHVKYQEKNILSDYTKKRFL